MHILSSFLSGFGKNVAYFYVLQLEVQKVAFQESDVIIFICFITTA